MAARKIPSSAPSTIVRPLVSEAQDYVTMKPLFKHKHRVFRGKEVKNCLPKGFRHSSAPSRFVNYHTLDVKRLAYANQSPSDSFISIAMGM
ncbi:hypothetical protein CFP56_011071 [Quercus suber]|uniref:Uncharacterized protein n=1 Tax=Quercus suber TaxID=58331 RepID=A0AAW0L068_QUESU